MDTKTILNEASGRMQKAIDHLEEELLNVRAGKASPNALNGIMVDYFGSQVPVSGAASVTVPDAKTILIQPWDKNMLRPIEKAIIDSNIGLTPSNNGEQIRLSIPPLTEERRKELVKQIRNEAETARISLRNARRDAVEAFKKAQKEGMPEDESKDGEAQAQKLLEKFTKTLDEREEDILRNRILSETPLTLEDMGAKYGITKERTRQLEARIIKRLRDFIKKDVKDFDRLRM